MILVTIVCARAGAAHKQAANREANVTHRRHRRRNGIEFRQAFISFIDSDVYLIVLLLMFTMGRNATGTRRACAFAPGAACYFRQFSDGFRVGLDKIVNIAGSNQCSTLHRRWDLSVHATAPMPKPLPTTIRAPKRVEASVLGLGID
jgi:hypothetical protein